MTPKEIIKDMDLKNAGILWIFCLALVILLPFMAIWEIIKSIKNQIT
jgi:hypothetical protein